MPELNVFSACFFAVFILQYLSSVWIEKLNLAHLNRVGDTVPPGLRGLVDSEKLKRMNAYTVDRSRLFLVEKSVADAVLAALLLTGFLPWFGNYASSADFSETVAGFLFFLLVGAIFSVLGIPLGWYRTFVVEERYGFNRYDTRTWLLDLAKSAALSIALLAVVLIPVLWMIRAYPATWWLLAFLFVSLCEFALMVLYPVLIAPIFNTFRPLVDRELADKVEELVERAGMKSRSIVEMDAGRRSTHSNAYVAGLGKGKRIVLFDTFVERHSHDEILAVLAHEIGHSRLNHIMKSFAWTFIGTLAGFYLMYRLMNEPWVYETFGLSRSQPYLALFVVGVGLRKLGYFLKPIAAAVSRMFERQADAFSAAFRGSGEDLASALKKMAAHNLANLNPHPAYVWFHYSHPPLPERIASLKDGGQVLFFDLHPADSRSQLGRWKRSSNSA